MNGHGRGPYGSVAVTAGAYARDRDGNGHG